MNYRMICRVLGLILLALAGLLLLPLIAGLCFRENVLNFVLTIAISAALGGLLLIPRPHSRSLVARDGFVIVGLGWLLISLIGALPFYFSGSIPHYYDALFETASGLSTTGATVVTDIDAMPRGDLFWRLFTHWIGGMGVLVFIMAVLPMSGEHSMHIMRAEVPGPSVGKLVPRVRTTARILYLIYLGMTAAELILLLAGRMPTFDAVCTSLATAGTGVSTWYYDKTGEHWYRFKVDFVYNGKVVSTGYYCENNQTLTYDASWLTGLGASVTSGCPATIRWLRSGLCWRAALRF